MTLANKIGYFLIVFIVIFTVLAYGTVHQPVIAVFYILVVVLAVSWAIDGLARGSLELSPSLLQLPIYAISLYGFIQVLPFGRYDFAGVNDIPRTISLDPFSTEVNAVHFLALGLFFSLTITILDSAQRLKRTVTILTVFGFFYGFFAILQGVLSPTKIYGIYERLYAQPYGSFLNRHNFAAYMEMLIALPSALVLTSSVKRDQRLLYLTAIILMAVSLFLSGSRGGMISLMTELILLVMLTTPMHGAKKLFIRFALAGAMLVAIVAGTMFVGGDSSLTRIAETASSKDITTNRTHIWSVSVDVIRNNFPLGAGLGAFGVAYTPTDTSSGLERVEQAHNDYLQTISDAGLPGMLIGGAFLYLLIRTARRNVRRRNDFRRSIAIGATVGVAGVLVHSLFDFVLHTTAISVLFLLLVGILVSAGRNYRDDIRNENVHRHRRKGTVLPIRFAPR